jgi:serine protease
VGPQRHHGGGSLLAYQGGAVQTAPKVFLVFWGSQWNSNDPSGESSLLQSFFNGVGGSSWANTDSQYCQGVTVGMTQCGSQGTHAGNQRGALGGVWVDSSSAAPSHPTQSQLAAEAVSAAGHFGYSANFQYVVATATGNNSSGFGTSYCAYHSSVSSSFGTVAWTNLPYITDAGASCGANFNGLGANAGVTIVAGHEFAESVTDPFPSSGWVDGSGSEIGDKCAWITSGQGASADITLSTGTFAVQSLWSNAFNGGTGGCVVSYP